MRLPVVSKANQASLYRIVRNTNGEQLVFGLEAKIKMFLKKKLGSEIIEAGQTVCLGNQKCNHGTFSPILLSSQTDENK